VNTFNEDFLSRESQELICRFFKVLMENYSRIRRAREALIRKMEADPMGLYHNIVYLRGSGSQSSFVERRALLSLIKMS
jgi:hypothetical protein